MKKTFVIIQLTYGNDTFYVDNFQRRQISITDNIDRAKRYEINYAKTMVTSAHLNNYTLLPIS